MVADHTSRFMTKLFLTMTGAYKKRFKKPWAVKSGSLALQVAKKNRPGEPGGQVIKCPCPY